MVRKAIAQDRNVTKWYKNDTKTIYKNDIQKRYTKTIYKNDIQKRYTKKIKKTVRKAIAQDRNVTETIQKRYKNDIKNDIKNDTKQY